MLQVHSSSALPALAARLAAVLAVTPQDPMQREWVAVPSAGMRTWLALALSRRLGTSPGGADGISANIHFAFPGELRTSVLGADRGPDAVDLWSVDRMVWPIIEVSTDVRRLDGEVDLPKLLTAPPAGASRYSAARRVADLFDRYHLHRPEMIRSWAVGHDVDGVGAGLAPQYRWQPALWRAVRELIGESGPEQWSGILRRLRSGELVTELPSRLCVFGMSLLPAGSGFLELGAALGTPIAGGADQREVHLFVIGPSPALASGLGRSLDRSDLAPSDRAMKRSELDALAEPSHPLLRSWGRMHRETAALLVNAARNGVIPAAPWDTDAAAGAEVGSDPGPDGHGADDPPPTMLTHLQRAIRADVAPAADVEIPSEDRSISFHACHGPARQVEVLRDQILGLLAANPDLDEDDVLVVCPDLESFAPVIEATSGRRREPAERTTVGGPVRADGEIQLRYQIADRSIGAAASLVGAFSTLLELVTGRFDAPSVLDFLSLDPVQFRHHLSEDDLATVAGWVSSTRARWGLDPQQRARHDLPESIVTNTWRASTDRLLVGAATIGSNSIRNSGGGGVDISIGDVVPFDNEGSDVAVAGRLAEIMWRLGELADAATVDRPLTEWIGLLRDALDVFFGVPRDQQWQRDRLLRTFGEILRSATDPDTAVVSDPILGFTDVRRLLDERIGAIAGRPSFFRGGITVTSLTPLRWVPYQVVCMLGMDTAALGSSVTDGDDLAALDPLVGDRDRRSELRQSLLETVLSAQRALVIVRDGSDVRTNQTIPAAVALAELRDAILAMATPRSRDALAERLETTHPRQPFDERYFDGRMLRSFDGPSLRAAVAHQRRSDTTAGVGLGGVRLDPVESDESVIDLADLHRFLRNPVQFFLERRLEIRLPERGDQVKSVLDVKFDGLSEYALGTELLQLRADRDPGDDAFVADWRRAIRLAGLAPAGALGDQRLDWLNTEVDQHLDAARKCGAKLGGPVEHRSVAVELADGTTVSGDVQLGLDAAAGYGRRGPARILFSRPAPWHRLATWLDVTALAADDPVEPWCGLAVTRNTSKPRTKDNVEYPNFPVVTHVALRDDDPVDPKAVLEEIVELYRRGLREPLPLFRKLSWNLYQSPDKTPEWPERYPNPAEQLVYGDFSAKALIAVPVEAGDPDGPAPGRVLRYAQALFGAMEASLEDVGA